MPQSEHYASPAVRPVPAGDDTVSGAAGAPPQARRRSPSAGRRGAGETRRAAADRLRVGIVDAHPLFRQGLANALGGADLTMVAEGGTAAETCRVIEVGRPDVLLIDIDVPGDGVGAAREALRARADMKVVVLTARDDEDDVTGVLRMGVHGYILKDVSGPELVSAIEAIHRGEPYVTPALASRLLMGRRGRPLPSQTGEDMGLTPRDRRILGYLAKGLTNQEIAGSLGMNVRTVKHHLTQVFRKMRVRNRVEATLEAQRMRLLSDTKLKPTEEHHLVEDASRIPSPRLRGEG